MLKKLILSSTLLFLLFEALFFLSNKKIEEMQANTHKNEVYKITLLEEKEEFKKNYQNLILEEDDDSILLITSKKNLEEIKEKYKITIEN